MMAQRRRMLVNTNARGPFGVLYDKTVTAPALTRLGAAVSKSAVAGIGTVAQVSDFDNMPIYKDIKLCNVAANGTVNAYEGDVGFSRTGSNGDVMVEIPAFYYKTIVDSTHEEWWISPIPADGFVKHPAFCRGGAWADLDYIYIGAYEASVNGGRLVSQTGVATAGNNNRDTYRNYARAKQSGAPKWNLVDIAAIMAVNMLIYIEYATLDVQTAIAPGHTNGSAKQSAGGTDSMVGHTGRPAGTANAVGMKWRGIENWWGDIWAVCDGVINNSNTIYTCLNPSYYAGTLNANYAQAYTIPAGFSSTPYVKSLAYNANIPWLRLPGEVGGSATTYYCDTTFTQSAANMAVAFGGGLSEGTGAGLACWFLSTLTHNNVGTRLLYLPLT